MARNLAVSAPAISIRRYCARRPRAPAAASCIAGAAELLIGEPIRPSSNGCAGTDDASPVLSATPAAARTASCIPTSHARAVRGLIPAPAPLLLAFLRYLLDFRQSPIIVSPGVVLSCARARRLRVRH